MAHEIPWDEDILPECAPARVVEAFIELLGKAWEEVKDEYSPDLWENHITDKLVSWMQDTLRRNQAKWFLFSQNKPPVTNYTPHTRPYGFCDITLIIYSIPLIFECKRLNVVKCDGSCAKLATEYVKEGVNRYLFPEEGSNKTAPQYPSPDGLSGMLGFVMNGIISDAHKAVQEAISLHAVPQAISDPHKPICPAMGAHRFLTVHSDCTGKTVHMHHVLLPVTIPPLSNSLNLFQYRSLQRN